MNVKVLVALSPGKRKNQTTVLVKNLFDTESLCGGAQNLNIYTHIIPPEA